MPSAKTGLGNDGQTNTALNFNLACLSHRNYLRIRKLRLTATAQDRRLIGGMSLVSFMWVIGLLIVVDTWNAGL